jgi:hypothetical protein
MPNPWTIGPDEVGLEIGPLDRPRVLKNDHDVLYIDHADTSTLRSKYADYANVGEIRDVDYVWGGTGSIQATLGSQGPFDYVIASHVIEHVPNPIEWLNELASVLKVGGRIHLMVPDKRFCFDVNRAETRIWDLVDPYLRHADKPTPRQIFEFQSNYLTVDTVGLWEGRVNYDGTTRDDIGDVDKWCLELCQQQLETGDYIDVHCWSFTPSSFADAIHRLVRLDLLRLRLDELIPTPRHALEFYVTLRVPEPTCTRAELEQAAWEARMRADSGPSPAGHPSSTSAAFVSVDDRLAELGRRLDAVAASSARTDRLLDAMRHPAHTSGRMLRARWSRLVAKLSPRGGPRRPQVEVDRLVTSGRIDDAPT